jgi:hypothetical protein
MYREFKVYRSLGVFRIQGFGRKTDFSLDHVTRSGSHQWRQFSLRI